MLCRSLAFAVLVTMGETMRISPGVITISFLLAIAAAPARAEVVTLYCSWPNDIGFIVDIDYATSRVSIISNGLPNVRSASYRAQVTDHDIRWSGTAFPNVSSLAPSEFRINRLTAELTACNGGPNSLNENFCSQPMKCIPRKPVF